MSSQCMARRELIPLLSLKLLCSIQKVDNHCGESTWKAANVGGRKFAKKDETGVMLGTCRHTMILRALDMYRGEIYEYPYILQVALVMI